jgi:multifunctional beta-oxidation protein
MLIASLDDGRATNPASIMDSQQAIFGNLENDGSEEDGVFADPEDSDSVREAKKIVVEPLEYEYDHKQVILYNLGIGATEKQVDAPLKFFKHQLKWII